MTRFLEQKKKDYYCTTPHCSKKKTVKVKMQKTPLTLKHSLKFSALNCVTKEHILFEISTIIGNKML